MGARFYSPGTGRFISQDPIGYAGGLNLYTYCRNNPVNLIDPSGLTGNLTQSAVQALEQLINNHPEVLVPLGAAAPPVVVGTLIIYTGAQLFNPNHDTQNLTPTPEPGPAPQPAPASGGAGGKRGGRRCDKDNLSKTANDLISGTLKKSNSYHTPYGEKTYQEIIDLSKTGDQKARKMLKLIEQKMRLMENR